MYETTDIVVVGIRALAFIAVFQAAGSSFYLTFFSSRFQNSHEAQERIVLALAVGAALLVVMQHVVEPARMAASFSGIWDSTLQIILIQSDAGAARAVRIVGLGVIACGVFSRNGLRGQLMLAGAVVALMSFLLMGHTANHPQRWMLSVLLLVHIAVVAFWFGALLAFILGSKAEKLSAFGAVVKEFSDIAVRFVPVIPLAGLVMAWLLLPDFASLTSPYGVLLIAKILGFGLLMMLAAWNKLRLSPALIREEPAALRQFRFIVLGEWLIIGLVLAMTATMTGLFGPE